MPAPVVVYSDFNCPFCYALNEALLRLNLAEPPAWRGVQHAPGLLVPMTPWRGALAEDLEREVEAVRLRAPDLPITLPPGKPNTARAIRAAALALQLDRQRGPLFKDLLYRAFWCRGAISPIRRRSIGSPRRRASPACRSLNWIATPSPPRP